MPLFYILTVVLMLILVVRVPLHFLDTGRILSAAQQKGWQNVIVTWAPFAPGWFFEKGERHYLVVYRDEAGQNRQRYCKTGMFTGVFWRDETV